MTQAAELAGMARGQLGLERLFWAVSDAVVVGDARSGKIVLWNPAAERLFGYHADEAIGLALDVLVPDAFKARHRDGLARYVKTGHGPLIDGGTPIELTAVDKNGQPHLVELSLAPVTGSGTSELMVVAIIRDVSHRKLAEDQQRRRLQVEAERADALDRARRASLIAEVSTALARGATLGHALDACATALGQFVDGSVVHIWTLNETERVLELQATSGPGAPTGRVQKRMRVASTDIGKIGTTGAKRVVDTIPSPANGSGPDTLGSPRSPVGLCWSKTDALAYSAYSRPGRSNPPLLTQSSASWMALRSGLNVNGRKMHSIAVNSGSAS